MKHKMKAALAVGALAAIALTGCTAADSASYNISSAADNFEVQRRVVFFNGITDTYLLEIEGRCSIEEDVSSGRPQLEVTCKIGPDEYKKHFLGLSDNVSYFVEQGPAIDVSMYHYRVNFRPEAILPEFSLEVGEQ